MADAIDVRWPSGILQHLTKVNADQLCGSMSRNIVFFSSTSCAYPFLSQSTRFLDVDNDGWLQIPVVNGHVFRKWIT